VVAAPVSGKIKRITVKKADELQAGDLLVEIEENED